MTVREPALPTDLTDPTRTGRADRSDVAHPGWRPRPAQWAAALALLVWLILFGWDLSSTLSGRAALPAVVQDTALAAVAALILAALLDLAVAAGFRTVRRDLADVGRRQADLGRQIQQLAGAVRDLADAIGERVDSEYLAGVQATLDDLSGGRPPSPVVPINGRQASGGRRG
jgi:hypothetical protein